MKKLKRNKLSKFRISLAHLERDIVARVKKYGGFSSAKYCIEDSVVCMNWSDEEARERLMMSKYNHDFFRLANMFQPQKNPFYCGIATMVTVLNALRVNKGTIPNQEGLYFDHMQEDGTLKHMPYRLYSQKTFLNEETEKVKKKSNIWPKAGKTRLKNFNPGLTLQEMCAVLEVYEANVEIYIADEDIETGIAHFRDNLKQHLLNEDHFMIINFDGRVIGADVGGHFSTVAAYHERTDTALVLDPAAHKNPWYWVPLNHLYYAMHTKDGSKYRGFVIVSDND